MAALEKSVKIVPYIQKELNDEIGLTCRDMAVALSTTPHSVRRKVTRGDFLKKANTANFKVKPCVFTNKINGLAEKGFVFNLNAAKAFIAKWDNDQGWGYLSFLIDCEKVVLESVPKLIRELSDSKEIIKKLTKPKHGRLANGDACVTLTQIEVRKDMFGTEYYEPLRVKVKLSDLDQSELAEYKLRHITKVQKGLLKASEKALDKSVFVNKTNIKKLGPANG